MSDVKIEHKETMSRDEAAAWLSVLSKALAADGEVDLQLGQSEIQVHVPDQLAAEFEVEVEGDEVEIELEFSWSKRTSRARASRRSGAAR
jgi:amphi-Trp domain-containing protein